MRQVVYKETGRVYKETRGSLNFKKTNPFLHPLYLPSTRRSVTTLAHKSTRPDGITCGLLDVAERRRSRPSTPDTTTSRTPSRPPTATRRHEGSQRAAPSTLQQRRSIFGSVSDPPADDVDVLCIGAGIMSSSVALLLKLLEPSWKIKIVERLEAPALESSEAYNNAGTGHSAYCELNYTPEVQRETGAVDVDVSKAIEICEKFHTSKQWWSYLVKEKILDIPVKSWNNPTGHMAFVHGDKNVEFLKKRYEAMRREPLFSSMQYSDKEEKVAEWAPLLLDGRGVGEPLAVTMMDCGTDNDWGSLTGGLTSAFLRAGGQLETNTEAQTLTKNLDGTWTVNCRSTVSGMSATGLPDPFGLGAREQNTTRAKFVYIGAGGASIQLLQKSGIPEIKGYGGFPISGQFFVCRNPSVVQRHTVKAYGKASVGAPPMSVPHLDRRYIRGEELLLFGPFAGFSPNFLKRGSPLDLLSSVNPFNLIPMAAAGGQNIDLSVYLAKELAATKEERMGSLREFYPAARSEDWEQITAGQRVQIMKEHPSKYGVIQFGTEIIQAGDGTLSGLMGASPGASVSVQVALDVVEKAFGQLAAGKWKGKLEAMVPGFKKDLNLDKDLYEKIVLGPGGTHETLGIRN
ncbi:unnamed protein product [Amoebophrya sp. A25]|nr:unnamed protein product [Amoebophrya sp. A25]|eukprot:GSA25T00026769001.1